MAGLKFNYKVNKVGIIIQARTGSSRLPGKILLPFYNTLNVLQYLLEQLLKNFPPEKIVIATTTSEQDVRIKTIAREYNLSVFSGEEDNVLKRMVDASDKFQFDSMIRVCSDNPFISTFHIQQLIDGSGKHDYFSYATSSATPVIKTHYGFFTEYITTNALKKVLTLSKDKDDLEHVTSFIYTNKDEFKIDFLPLPYNLDEYPFIRTTLDDNRDLENLKFIVNKLKGDTGIENIIDLINKSPQLKASMIKQIKKYTK